MDSHNGKPKFKVINGKRMNGAPKYFWGQHAALTKNNLVGLDNCIRETTNLHELAAAQD